MAKKKAVVCEQDATLTRILKHLLGKQGFEVSAADNGNRGLALIHSAKPSLVVLDLELSGKDGAELLSELRGGDGAKPYVIALTAHESKGKHAQASAAGAQEVWATPFSAAKLLKRLEALAQQGKV
jgi:DNA-binding response OmpR family regulator